MSELLNKHLETVKTPLVTAGLVSMLGAITFKADQYFGTRKAMETAGADLDFYIDQKPGADKTLVLLGGLCMTGDRLARSYAAELTDDVNLLSPIYGSNGFDAKDLFEKLYHEVEKTKPKEIIIAGLSMGGLLAFDWVGHGLRTGRSDTVSKVSESIVRGVPASAKAIRPAPRLLLHTASKVGYSYALEQSRPLLKHWDCVSLLEASPVTIVQQCRYLSKDHSGSLPNFPGNITFVRGASADPIVNEDIAVNNLEQRLHKPITQAIDSEYLSSAHVPTDRHSIRFMLAQLGIARQPAEELTVQPTPLLQTQYYPAAA